MKAIITGLQRECLLLTIRIVSFPGPDRSVTQEGLKKYRVSNRRYRNRRIGDFLKELHLTEGRNTGFKKILDALEENGSPKPIFETDDDHSYFISRLFIHKGFLKEEPKRSQKGAEKKPKRSRKKQCDIKSVERDSNDDAGNAYGPIEIKQKTSTNGYKGTEGAGFS